MTGNPGLELRVVLPRSATSKPRRRTYLRYQAAALRYKKMATREDEPPRRATALGRTSVDFDEDGGDVVPTTAAVGQIDETLDGGIVAQLDDVGDFVGL